MGKLRTFPNPRISREVTADVYMLYNIFYTLNECSGRATENLMAGGSTGVIFFASGQEVLTPQAHFAFSSFKSGMGTNLFELVSLALNECLGRAMENLTTGGSTGVIFFASGQAVRTPQGHFAFSPFNSGMGTNFSVESSSWVWNEYSESRTETLTTGDSSCVKVSVFGKF
jgi:hypothetical protein